MAGVPPLAQGMACGTSGCCSAPVRNFPGRNSSAVSFSTAAYRCNRASATKRDSKIRAVSAPEECNEEDCAPAKEVGKISLEWVAEERTKVTGTYPPRRRAYTGYVEKDTAGQTNVYAVEPTVYVADSALSSGTAGTSTEGTVNVVTISAALGLIAIAGAAVVLLNVGKNAPVPETTYSGPPLSYYIEKFSPPLSVEAPAPTLEAPDVLAVSETTLEAPAPVETPALEVASPEADETQESVESRVAEEPVAATPETEASTGPEEVTLEPSEQESTPGVLPVSESAAPQDASPSTDESAKAALE